MSDEMQPIPLKSIPAYEGPNAIPGIRFKAARGALGVTSWGMNVLEIDPHCEGHPEHDHKADGQEEVYFVVRGAIDLRVGGNDIRLKEGDFVRVPAEVTRKLVTGEQSATVLALGATPGKVFEPTM